MGQRIWGRGVVGVLVSLLEEPPLTELLVAEKRNKNEMAEII